MSVQTTYERYHDSAFEGQFVNILNDKVRSKAAEEAIPFGRAIVIGTSENQTKLPSASTDIFLGISGHTSAWSVNSEGVHQYEALREVNYIDDGDIWVKTEQAVVYGDPVFYRFAENTGDVLGAFRKDADNDGSNDTAKRINAIFTKSADADGLTTIRLAPYFL